jgi:periplasmic copper chaperone A
MWQKYFFGLALVAMTGVAWAADNATSGSGTQVEDTHGVKIRDAWVGATTPGQTMASVHLTLVSTAASGRLIAADSPAADSAEIQRPWPSGGKIRMVKVARVRFRHGKPVTFGDNSVYYLMLLGLKQPLKLGDHVPVDLTVFLVTGDKVTVTAQAEVREAVDSDAVLYPQSEIKPETLAK